MNNTVLIYILYFATTNDWIDLKLKNLPIYDKNSYSKPKPNAGNK